MITDLHTQLTKILGGYITKYDIDDYYFGIEVEYTEKYPLYVSKAELFKEQLSNLFDCNESDITFDCKTEPPTWNLWRNRSSRLVKIIVVIRNIPKYIMDQIMKSDNSKVRSINYSTTK